MIIARIWMSEWRCAMTELLFFFIGMILGGLVASVILCCFQLHRINRHEARLQKLKAQLSTQDKN